MPQPAALRSEECDAVGLEALAAVDDIDPDALAGVQRIEAAAPQCGDMDKYVLAAGIRRDKAVPLFGLEPLDGAVHRGRRTHRAALAAAGGDGRTVVDVEDVSDERPLGPGADLAGNRGALLHIL